MQLVPFSRGFCVTTPAVALLSVPKAELSVDDGHPTSPVRRSTRLLDRGGVPGLGAITLLPQNSHPMCGRVTQRRGSTEIADLFGAEDLAGDPGGRFNVAPTDPLTVVVEREGRRAVTSYRWGLVPPWAESPKVGARMINARAETIATSPAFRGSVRSRRCLVPADGFYEWRRLPDGHRQPFFITRADGAPLAFAGLWSAWREPGADGPSLRTCAIVTTTPNELLAQVHNRMPVILAPEHWTLWLGTSAGDLGELVGFLRPSPPEELVAYPVDARVNSVRNNGPELVEAVGPALR